MALEISSFIIGLSGLVGVVEKSFQIWQSISEARGFGSDLIGIAAQLSMEYYRFLAWVRVSQALQPPEGDVIQSTASDMLMAKGKIASLPLNDDLGSQLQAPILDAVGRIVTILDEVSKIAEKYAIRSESTTAKQQKAYSPGAATPKSLAQGLSTVLPIVGVRGAALTSVMTDHRQSASTLQKRNSFRVKLTFGSKPWGQPDKKLLEDKVKELAYWNDRLEGLLPRALRTTIENQAIPGQILLEENKTLLDDLIKASEHQNIAVRTHAKLWKERIEFSKNAKSQLMILESCRRSSTVVVPLTGLSQSQCELSLATLNVGEDVVTVEWYPYESLGWSVEDLKLATGRLAELVHLCSREERPQSLRTLESICFVDDGKSLGFVSRLPGNISSTKQPTSLYSLLHRDSDAREFRPPELGQRLLLAQTLAGSVYSFSLIRCSSSAAVMLANPYITGFSISRPDNPGEISLDKEREKSEIYLHPDLRVAYPENERPRYSRKYEIYALGLLLFEIGVWRGIEDVIKSSTFLPPQKFTQTVVNRASKDLPFFVGNQYRDVVVRCLTCVNEDADESTASLDTIYWSIVLELAKCR
ncbi:hypothetical protein G7Y89_g6709 [Cudoniella acicularis]|uniref:Prion-inhibition and propagation HeLo domain-containing protein n=1 Tax=Cudoniella acicularis TaxID=354080 RepID=A0A8H4W590_9HELO|nr:hypothetical protein G7Y89_g6709 [Cudoniella acicularis]